MPTPQIHIPANASPKANTNFATVTQTSTDWEMVRRASSAAQNDEVTYDFYADAGTYDLVVFHRRASNGGIFTVQIDGVTVGTVDNYAAAAASVRSVITGVVVTTGVHTLRLVMTTKNASSSAYLGQFGKVGLIKTA